jgi:transcriptional regulator with XRE-family HTH domain
MKDKIINNIKTIRESRNYTETYMAEKLGMTQGAYNRKENGDLEFNISELVKMGEILDVSPSRFIDLDLARIINNPQINDNASGNNGFIENYNSNDEGYKAALSQYKEENDYLKAQLAKLTDALIGK